MNIDLNTIATNPYLTITSFLLAILSIFFAVVFYLKSKREKRPRYEIYTQTLIEGPDTEFSDLKILYKNEPQERITISKLAFWNAGRETINKTDMTETDALRIEVAPDARVLDVKLLSQSEPSNQFDLGSVTNSDKPKEKTIIPLLFDYIDHRNAAVIQLIHTGDHSTKIRVYGKIKGAERIEKVRNLSSMYTKEDPFFRGLANLLSNPIAIGKIASFSYLMIGIVGVILLLAGFVTWYSWVLTGVGFLFAIIVYIYIKPTSPIDLFD